MNNAIREYWSEIDKQIEYMESDYLLLGNLALREPFMESFKVVNGPEKQSAKQIASIKVSNRMESPYSFSLQIFEFVNTFWSTIENDLVSMFTDFKFSSTIDLEELKVAIGKINQSPQTVMSLVLNPTQSMQFQSQLAPFANSGANTHTRRSEIAEYAKLHPSYICSWNRVDVYRYEFLQDQPGALILDGKSIYFTPKTYGADDRIFTTELQEENHSFNTTLVAKCEYNRNLVPSLGIKIN